MNDIRKDMMYMKFVNVDTEKWGTVKVIVDECVTVGFPLEIDVDENNQLYVKGFEKYNFKNGNKLDLRIVNWHEEYEALLM